MLITIFIYSNLSCRNVFRSSKLRIHFFRSSFHFSGPGTGSEPAGLSWNCSEALSVKSALEDIRVHVTCWVEQSLAGFWKNEVTVIAGRRKRMLKYPLGSSASQAKNLSTSCRKTQRTHKENTKIHTSTCYWYRKTAERHHVADLWTVDPAPLASSVSRYSAMSPSKEGHSEHRQDHGSQQQANPFGYL